MTTTSVQPATLAFERHGTGVPFAPFARSRGLDLVSEPLRTATLEVPSLAVFGQQRAREERDDLRRLLPGMQVEEWSGRGHFVHLADADRFAPRLHAFAQACKGDRS